MWKYYKPKFEYRKNLDDRDFPWAGHIFFGYDLVRNMQPKRIVELGTHKGTSFYSFLQGLKDGELEGEAFAVDSWEGDEHAGTDEQGYESEESYNTVVKNLRDFYSKQNARLLKMYFDDALEHFKDHSITLLHIDGLHTYEAVMHDYDTWKNKLEKDNIVIFHDIIVGDFGVWKVWEELKETNKNSLFIEFKHSHGLGVMVTGDRYIKLFENEIKDIKRFRSLYEIRDLEQKLSYTRDKVGELNRLNDHILSLNEENTILKHYNMDLKVLNNKLNNELTETKQDLKVSKNALNALTSRKIVRIYRKGLRYMGRDIRIDRQSIS